MKTNNTNTTGRDEEVLGWSDFGLILVFMAKVPGLRLSLWRLPAGAKRVYRQDAESAKAGEERERLEREERRALTPSCGGKTAKKEEEKSEHRTSNIEHRTLNKEEEKNRTSGTCATFGEESGRGGEGEPPRRRERQGWRRERKIRKRRKKGFDAKLWG